MLEPSIYNTLAQEPDRATPYHNSQKRNTAAKTHSKNPAFNLPAQNCESQYVNPKTRIPVLRSSSRQSYLKRALPRTETHSKTTRARRTTPGERKNVTRFYQNHTHEDYKFRERARQRAALPSFADPPRPTSYTFLFNFRIHRHGMEIPILKLKLRKQN